MNVVNCSPSDLSQVQDDSSAMGTSNGLFPN